MTKRDQYNFILHVLLPAVEREGLTIKTRRDGELTLSATGSVTTNFISNLRQHCIEELQRPSIRSPDWGQSQMKSSHSQRAALAKSLLCMACQ